MAVTTTNEKLSLMEDVPWEPGLPISPSTFGTDDNLQLIWEYPFAAVFAIIAVGDGSVGSHGRRKGITPYGIGGFPGVYD